jgi:Zn-dependent protease/predicted transcriptional regulator
MNKAHFAYASAPAQRIKSVKYTRKESQITPFALILSKTKTMKSFFDRSLKLGKLFGIPVSIHWTFLLLLIWIFGSSIYKGSSLESALWSVAYILILFVCVFLHELGHALMAKRYGIATRSIVLLPIGGVASLEKIPSEPKKEIAVALAGPAVNLVISGGLLVYHLIAGFPSIEAGTAFRLQASTLPFMVMIANLFLGGFNLLPAFPMDGGRVLRALLAIRMNRERATATAMKIATVFAVIFALYGLFNNPFMVFIALFIFLGARGEYESVRTEYFISGFTAKDVLMTRYTVLKAETPLSEAVSLLLGGQETRFLVEKEGAVSMILTKTDIIRGLDEHGKESPIASSASALTFSAPSDMPMQELLDTMRKENLSMVPITDDGEIIGVVDIDNISEFQLIRMAQKR